MLTYFFPILPFDFFREDQIGTLGKNVSNWNIGASYYSNAPSHTIVETPKLVTNFRERIPCNILAGKML